MSFKNIAAALALVLTFALPCFANQSAIVDCKQGGQVVVTSGLTSTTKVLQSFPSCTITVFTHGVSSPLPSIFSDNVGTPLANPFIAQNSPYSGAGFFYAANGRYDIKISGGGLAAPITFNDIILNDPASVEGCSQLPALTGDITTAGGTCATVLPNIANAGTGLKVTINAKGQATAVTTAASTDLSDSATLAHINTPVIFTTVNGLTITTTTGTLTVTNGKTLSASNSLTLAGTDGTTLTFQGTGTVMNRDSADTPTNKTFDTAGVGNNLKINGNVVTAVTGTGATVVLSASPTLASPTFTTPTLGVATATSLTTPLVNADSVQQRQAATAFSLNDFNGLAHFFIANIAPYTNTFIAGNGAGNVFLGSSANIAVSDVNPLIIFRVATDTGLSASAAGILNVGNGTQGNASGELRSAKISATYNAAGTIQTGVHMVQDTCTLGTNCGVTLAGSAAFTNATSYTCTCHDQTTPLNACGVNQTAGNGFTITGTGTDVIRYQCIGN